MCYCLYQHPSFPIVVVCAFYESVCSLKQNASQHVKRLIVGNKSDFEAGRKVSTKQGRQVCCRLCVRKKCPISTVDLPTPS
jgi:hypothetical protein